MLVAGRSADAAGLAPHLDAFEAVTATLDAAAKARTAAGNQLIAHEVVRAREVDAVEALIAEVEPQILTRFPGRRDLLRAILAPPRRPRKKGGQSDVVATPEVEPIVVEN